MGLGDNFPDKGREIGGPPNGHKIMPSLSSESSI